MSIHDLYSKRKRRIENINNPELYQYENLPIKFRRQVIHIWNTAIVPFSEIMQQEWWDDIHDILLRELGLFSLTGKGDFTSFDECQVFLMDKETP
jgi:hypothetical protein